MIVLIAASFGAAHVTSHRGELSESRLTVEA